MSDERYGGTQRPPGGSGASSEVGRVHLPSHALRLVAFVVDVVAVAIPVGVLFMVGKLTRVDSLVLFVVLLAVTFVYYMAASVWLTDGETVGKALCSLRVHRSTAAHRGLRSFLWAAGRHSIGYVIVDVFGGGTLTALFTRNRRCLHDFAFDSRVVGIAEHATARERLAAYAERFEAALDEVKRPWQWLFFLWKWITRLVLLLASWLVVGSKVASAIDASAVAAPTTGTGTAAPLSAAMTAILWTATVVVTALAVVGVSQLGGEKPQNGDGPRATPTTASMPPDTSPTPTTTGEPSSPVGEVQPITVASADMIAGAVANHEFIASTDRVYVDFDASWQSDGEVNFVFVRLSGPGLSEPVESNYQDDAAADPGTFGEANLTPGATYALTIIANDDTQGTYEITLLPAAAGE